MRYLFFIQTIKCVLPIRVQGNGRDRKLLVKTRGTIESGYLKNKRMGL